MGALWLHTKWVVWEWARARYVTFASQERVQNHSTLSTQKQRLEISRTSVGDLRLISEEPQPSTGGPVNFGVWDASLSKISLVHFPEWKQALSMALLGSWLCQQSHTPCSSDFGKPMHDNKVYKMQPGTSLAAPARDSVVIRLASG